MRPTRALAGVSTALLAVLTVSACGSSAGSSASSRSGSPASGSTARARTTPSALPSAPASPRGPQDDGAAGKLLADTRSALFDAGAVHVMGYLHVKGQLVALDMQFQGQDASGTIGLGVAPVSIVRTGGKVYLRASAAFWQKAVGPNGAGLADRWLAVDAQQAAGLDDFMLPSLAASLSADGAPLLPLAERTPVDGQAAVEIARQDGSTVAVAATGAPVPLEIASGGASSSRNLVFSDYGKPVVIAPPPGALTAQEAAKAPATSTT